MISRNEKARVQPGQFTTSSDTDCNTPRLMARVLRDDGHLAVDDDLRRHLDQISWRSIRRQQRIHMSGADSEMYHAHRIKEIEAGWRL